ncbi:hypothetical protein CEP54_007062 [Fusarium duplospermum]|uniref:Uncharacterized protein n=1 Tax=Fusarium duplospermum TaxID=1325734 RepID=A0A428Q3P9_9HYPO|nr:hypothetical protein CEP54_007062 [Fusarium duplospermum]
MSTIQAQSEPSKLSEELSRITNATPSEADSPSCTNCESRSHTLVGCLYAPNGTIFGCPFCKNGTHLMEECSNFAAASIVDVVRVLIWSRSAMPAWQTKVPWHHYLAEFMSSTQFLPIVDYLHRWTVLHRPFPWSENFAQRFSQSDDFTLFQTELDGGCPYNLPFDPTTAGIVAACETYRIPFLVSWRGGDPVAREFPGPASTSTSSPASSPVSTAASFEFDPEDVEIDANDLDVDIGVPPGDRMWESDDEAFSVPGSPIPIEELRRYGIHPEAWGAHMNSWDWTDGA